MITIRKKTFFAFPHHRRFFSSLRLQIASKPRKYQLFSFSHECFPLIYAIQLRKNDSQKALSADSETACVKI
jgi:hypothetical protein